MASIEAMVLFTPCVPLAVVSNNKSAVTSPLGAAYLVPETVVFALFHAVSEKSSVFVSKLYRLLKLNRGVPRVAATSTPFTRIANVPSVVYVASGLIHVAVLYAAVVVTVRVVVPSKAVALNLDVSPKYRML